MPHAIRISVGEVKLQGFLNDSECARAIAEVLPLQSRFSVWGDEIYFDITADRFLHNMVRRLAGVLVEVGRRRFVPSDVRGILEKRDRSRGGPCLPPHGLFLVGVRYGPEDAIEPMRVDSGAPDA